MSLHSDAHVRVASYPFELLEAVEQAKFQRDCINSKKEDEMPVGTVKELLLRDCAAIDYSSAIERYKKRQRTRGHGRRPF